MARKGANVAIIRAYARLLGVRRGVLEHAVNALVPFFGDGFGGNLSGVVPAEGDHYLLVQINTTPTHHTATSTTTSTATSSRCIQGYGL